MYMSCRTSHNFVVHMSNNFVVHLDVQQLCRTCVRQCPCTVLHVYDSYFTWPLPVTLLRVQAIVSSEPASQQCIWVLKLSQLCYAEVFLADYNYIDAVLPIYLLLTPIATWASRLSFTCWVRGSSNESLLPIGQHLREFQFKCKKCKKFNSSTEIEGNWYIFCRLYNSITCIYTLLQKNSNFSEPIFPGYHWSLTLTPGHAHFVKWFWE